MTKFEEIKNHLLNNTYIWCVTGVAGFIGSHLLEFLLNHQQKVIGIDNFATGHVRNIEDVLRLVGTNSRYFTFVKGDVRDFFKYHQITKKIDFVLHHAALGSVPHSIEDPMTAHEINVTGFLNVLMAAKDTDVQQVIYASSSAIYGDLPSLPKVETDQCYPLSPYAVTKMTNELYAKVFGSCYAMKTIGLRYFNVFGPRQDPNGVYAAVIPLWINKLVNNKSVFINGDGQTSRDFCYVKDVVQANILAAFATQSEAFNTVYNIAAAGQTTLQSLYESLKQLTGNMEHQPIYREFRAGDIRHSVADIKKARRLLDYEPIYSVQHGLSETLQWYRQNK